MQYEVEIDGRLRQVQVHRADGRFLVNVDGRAWTLDAVRIDPQTLSLIIGTSSYEVLVIDDPASDRLSVGIGSVLVPVVLNGRRRWGYKDDTRSAGGGPQRVVAPMPGRIVRVLVKTGDAVRAKQPLLVIEAMKMENELGASLAGSVLEILVKEGQSVEAGAVLAVLATE